MCLATQTPPPLPQVPRQQVIQVLLLDALPLDTADLSAPAGGLTVGHIRSGEPLHVDLWLLGVFLLLTMADFAEQLMSWQVRAPAERTAGQVAVPAARVAAWLLCMARGSVSHCAAPNTRLAQHTHTTPITRAHTAHAQDALFSNTDGRLRMEGCAQPNPHVVWPGPMRPGLWMSAVSRMGRLLASCKQQLEAAGDGRAADLVLPPVFAHCSKVLGVQDEAGARDAYWQAVHSDADAGAQAALFARAAELNPYVAEPHLMLAQLHLHAGRWEDAQREAAAALALLADWGTAWDKRMPWDAWVAWTRVCMEAASARSWPATPLGVLSLGLVQGL